jgi:hypothetical protein
MERAPRLHADVGMLIIEPVAQQAEVGLRRPPKQGLDGE